MGEKYDVIVLGAGPAGLTAGIYLSRARVKTLIIDSGTAGGQMVMSYNVANYPGVETTSGWNISQTMLRQAKAFGCRVMTQSPVTGMNLYGEDKWVEVEDEGKFHAHAVITATGGVPRELGMESEQRFMGTGISYCATCDGDFFTDKEIVAIGGGNSALEEAVGLTKYASKVTIVHEFNEFQAQPWIVEEARKNEKIHFLMAQDIIEFTGKDHLEEVIVASKETGERTVIPAEGCFIFIGYVPNTAVFKGILEMNERGELIADRQMNTSVPGVFAAGDLREKRFRQITTSVADGTIAALSAIDYLQQRADSSPV
ncbi:MAG: pyridine nucleotide-disulfide oxidoreductase [Gemmatimonadaceae bacterium 4484_173]|jgi:thioredoxin reductase (NADPH)|nr:MAG: pyridine nucleotide-disulfide oxidoreductase [Gemmatimonadaceae bacterium 4484_173]RKZ04432.1 MAG: pyridine nucleotide-disulfide oxidoreductase [Candidatus Fermentibacteria bacterium]